MKIKYYDRVNWAPALVDITIIVAVILLENYWLLFLLILTGSYRIPKEKEEK